MMRWVYFVFGLSGAFLFYSGNLLWVEKRRRTRSATRRRRADADHPAHGLGHAGRLPRSVAGVLLTMVAGKWRTGSAANINSAYLAVYYSVFLGAVA